ncbi:MAG: alpha/beta hydrolase [Thermoflexibacteraceae bacterium]|jgi:pimeloyl-ACP methyl ester carboxylesterase
MHSLHYQLYGEGKQVFIAFHGFGQDATVFAQWQQLFPDAKLYCIDLFFHGQSQWTGENLRLSLPKWQALLAAFLTTHHIQRFSLIGFSLGGKIALLTYQLFAAQVEAVWLFAPDGLPTSRWYWLATKTPLRSLFRYLMLAEHPVFQQLLDVVSPLGIFPKKYLQFIKSQIRQQHQRQQVYATWLLYRDFEVNQLLIQEFVRQYATTFKVFVGKKDTFIRSQLLQKFVDSLQPFATLQVLDCGHHDLLVVYRKIIAYK